MKVSNLMIKNHIQIYRIENLKMSSNYFTFVPQSKNIIVSLITTSLFEKIKTKLFSHTKNLYAHNLAEVYY